MVSKLWDVNTITSRCLSTDFVVSDSKELKAMKSCVEPNKEVLVVESSQAREGTAVTFHCKVMSEDIRTKSGWNYPSCSGEKCTKSVSRELGKFLCKTCNRTVDYPVLRLKVMVANDTAHAIVVLFNEIATELLKCSADLLIEVLANCYKESHWYDSCYVTKIPYLLYGTYESFTCWKINPTELVVDGASSSNQTLTSNDPVPSFKRLTRQPFVCRSEVEDSDADEGSSPAKESDEFNVDGPLDKKKKKRYIKEDS
ncbi:replication protein A 70 kDa DNA-binding subunit C-like protein [Tanacetum coccineum]